MHRSISGTLQMGCVRAAFRMYTGNWAWDVITHNRAHDGFCLCGEQASVLLKVRMLLRVHIVRDMLRCVAVWEHQPGATGSGSQGAKVDGRSRSRSCRLLGWIVVIASRGADLPTYAMRRPSLI